jgi:hypothetical protein
MTLQLLPSECPYIRGKFYFLFYQCIFKEGVWGRATLYGIASLSVSRQRFRRIDFLYLYVFLINVIKRKDDSRRSCLAA